MGAEPVIDGGPVSGQVDLGSNDITTGFLDPPDVGDEPAPDVVADDIRDAAADRSPSNDLADAVDVMDVVADLGGCAGECAPGATRGCGSCGRQTCSSACQWGTCEGQGPCAPGASRGCGSCGRQTCNSACQWGGCEGQGVCAPGQRRGDGCDPCSEQVCSGACQWGGCQLRAGAACDYRGGRNARSCARCRCGLQWCLGTCQWSTDCVSCCTTCGGCL